MSKNTYPLKLPTSVKQAAAELAKEDGVSLNQFIAAAVAEKVGTMRTAREFFAERIGDANPEDLRKILDKVPARPPVPGDEIR
jgi:hypothetical protein